MSQDCSLATDTSNNSLAQVASTTHGNNGGETSNELSGELPAVLGGHSGSAAEPGTQRTPKPKSSLAGAPVVRASPVERANVVNEDSPNLDSSSGHESPLGAKSTSEEATRSTDPRHSNNDDEKLDNSGARDNHDNNDSEVGRMTNDLKEASLQSSSVTPPHGVHKADVDSLVASIIKSKTLREGAEAHGVNDDDGTNDTTDTTNDNDREDDDDDDDGDDDDDDEEEDDDDDDDEDGDGEDLSSEEDGDAVASKVEDDATADYSAILMRHSASKADVLKGAASLLESDTAATLRQERDAAVERAEQCESLLEAERRKVQGLQSRVEAAELRLKQVEEECSCGAVGTKNATSATQSSSSSSPLSSSSSLSSSASSASSSSSTPTPSLDTIKKLMNIIQLKDREVKSLQVKVKTAGAANDALQRSLEKLQGSPSSAAVQSEADGSSSFGTPSTGSNSQTRERHSASRTRQKFLAAQEHDAALNNSTTSGKHSGGGTVTLPDIHGPRLSDSVKRAAKNSTSRRERESSGSDSKGSILFDQGEQARTSSAATLRGPTQVQMMKHSGASPRTAPSKDSQHGSPHPRGGRHRSGGSGILDAQTLYVSHEELDEQGPIKGLRMEAQMAKLLKVLGNPSEDSDGPFQRRLDALVTFRRMLLHHLDEVRMLPRPDLFALTSGVLTSVNSLRSEAMKNGLMTLGEMFEALGSTADCVLDQVLPTLVRRASTGANFIIDEAVGVLRIMTQHSTHSKLLGRLVQQRAKFCSAKDAKVRHRVFLVIGDILAAAGGLAAFKSSALSKLLSPLARELGSKVSDSRAEVRAAVKVALYNLCFDTASNSPEVEALRDLMPSTQYERVRSAMKHFAKAGAPGGMKGADRATPANTKLGAGSSAAATPAHSHHRRVRSTADRKGGASASECKAAAEVVKLARQDLDKKDWSTRAKSLQSLCDAVARTASAFDPSHAASNSVATSNIFAFFDCIAAGVADGNSKVNAAALQGLLDALTALPSGGLSKIGLQLVDLLARARGSKNRDVSCLGAACLDRLLDRLPAGRSVSLLVSRLVQKLDSDSGSGGGKEGGSSVAELLDGLALQMQRLAANGAGESKAKQLVVKKSVAFDRKVGRRSGLVFQEQRRCPWKSRPASCWR
eukprot:INCI7196.6.p1 GENE.INCI7196.6~~INCI7196.6.p1  ORF type:complete len:1139 (+),score=258.21 INCI7196.6:284-3700(+)